MTLVTSNLKYTARYIFADDSFIIEEVSSLELDELTPPEGVTCIRLLRTLVADAETGDCFAAPAPQCRVYYVGRLLSIPEVMAEFHANPNIDDMIDDAEYYRTNLLIVTEGGRYFGYHRKDVVIAPSYWDNLREATADETA